MTAIKLPDLVDCPPCKGKGAFVGGVPAAPGPPWHISRVTCDRCHGTGRTTLTLDEQRLAAYQDAIAQITHILALDGWEASVEQALVDGSLPDLVAAVRARVNPRQRS